MVSLNSCEYSAFCSYHIPTFNFNILCAGVLASSVSPSIALFALVSEFSRLGAANRNRAVFEKAISITLIKNNIALWRLFIRFLLNMCSFLFALTLIIHFRFQIINGFHSIVRYEFWRGAKVSAKRLLYRALQQCPWSKQLWLDALSLLSSSMSGVELQEMFQFLPQSRLRIHDLDLPNIVK
jgi:hypothetical protein